MRKALVVLVMPLVLLAATGSMITGRVVPAATHVYDDATIIHLPCGIDIDTRNPDLSKVNEAMMVQESDADVGIYLVQFDGPVYAHERRGLESTGAEIIGYIPNYTYLVRADRDARKRISSAAGVSWIGDYHPAYKISTEIDEKGKVPEKLEVVMYPGTDPKSITDEIENLGGEVLACHTDQWSTVVHVMLAPEKIEELVVNSDIKWVALYHQDYVHNSSAQWVIQTWESENRRIWDEGLTGEGQILASMDSGIRTTHNFFRDPSVSLGTWGDYPNHRKILGYKKSAQGDDNDSIIQFGDHSGHGTHTAGSIAGDDGPTGGGSVNDGMAPDAKLFFIDAGGSLYPNAIIHAVSLEYSLSIAYDGNSAGGAKIISNSWGGSSRKYDRDCLEADRTMWNRPDYLVVFSAGNTDTGIYTGTPANAKNILTVGACGNGTYATVAATLSCQGPAEDGRIRPDIMAPGLNVNSSWAGSDDQEFSASGTSMACPVAAGNAGLVRQYFVDGYYPTGSPSYNAGFDPSAALVKAMMINAVETDYFGHDVPAPKVGWGRPKLDNVLYFAGDTRRVAVVDFDEGLETGYQFLGSVTVTGDTEPLRITLNWTDYPGEEEVNPSLVNDLNLEVVSPSGTVYRGNNFANNFSEPDGDFDDLNPTENVFVESPEAGTWEIRVQANNVPRGPQPFALVVTGALDNLISGVSITDLVVDDAGEANPDGNMDPGEDVTLYVHLMNVGESPITDLNATLSTASSHVTITDPDASYGTINAGETKGGDGFGISASASAPLETWVELEMDITSPDLSGTIMFELMLGTPRYDWVNHDIGNMKLSVTQQGSVGYLVSEGDGEGWCYPKSSSSWLYHGTFAAGNSADYVMDRMFDGSKARDWKVLSDPDGRVIIGKHDISNQDSEAHYDDYGNFFNPAGLTVHQYGYAWSGTDFIIMKYVLENKGSSTLSNMYAGVMTDLDMGDNSVENLAGVDEGRNMAYMWQTSDVNPHLGLKILEGTPANVSIISNPDYVWDSWDDATFFDFLSGNLEFKTAPNDTDYSIIVSVSLTETELAPGEFDTVAFAFVGGESLSDLQANADEAQQTWDNIDFAVEEDVASIPAKLDLSVSPGIITGTGAVMFSLPQAADTRLDVFDLSGRKVATLLKGNLTAGRHEIFWDGRDERGAQVSNGVYFFSLKADDDKLVYKTVIVR